VQIAFVEANQQRQAEVPGQLMQPLQIMQCGDGRLHYGQSQGGAGQGGNGGTADAGRTIRQYQGTRLLPGQRTGDLLDFRHQFPRIFDSYAQIGVDQHPPRRSPNFPNARRLAPHGDGAGRAKIGAHPAAFTQQRSFQCPVFDRAESAKQPALIAADTRFPIDLYFPT